MPQVPPRSQANSSASQGTCSVCLVNYQVIVATGMMRKHGHTRDRPPCPGSHQPPVRPVGSQLSISSASSQPSPVGTLDDGGCRLSQSAPSFRMPTPSGPILARIPKGARTQAAAEFEKRLSSVVRSPNDVNCWGHLLGFAGAFIQPSREGG